MFWRIESRRGLNGYDCSSNRQCNRSMPDNAEGGDDASSSRDYAWAQKTCGQRGADLSHGRRILVDSGQGRAHGRRPDVINPLPLAVGLGKRLDRRDGLGGLVCRPEQLLRHGSSRAEESRPNWRLNCCRVRTRLALWSKARYRVRGERLPRRDSHPVKYTALQRHIDPYSLRPASTWTPPDLLVERVTLHLVCREP